MLGFVRLDCENGLGIMGFYICELYVLCPMVMKHASSKLMTEAACFFSTWSMLTACSF